jgi:hypothetical protein
MADKNFYLLPNSKCLDIAILARIFSDTTNSYKFLFFLSIIQLLERNQFNQDLLKLKDILVEMLTIAWYPHSVFNLSFGSQDKITRELDTLRNELKLDKYLSGVSHNDQKNIREIITQCSLSSTTIDLLRYVPYRLVRPFFSDLLRGLKDQQVNQRINDLADQEFETRKPLYKFNQSKDSIILHPLWIGYFQVNLSIVRAWVAWEFLQYMQSKNPSTPAIANKIFPPLIREPMTQQTDFWKLVIQYSKNLRCIYSDQIIQEDFSLDHYLPWTFVAHNQLWNLIPVPKSVNSSKSNKVPSDIYFDKFIQVQHLGLTIANERMSRCKWAESYILDLGFSSKDELLSLENLRRQYNLKVKPLIALAISQGFEGEWKYKC